jgi:hypothetical protein
MPLFFGMLTTMMRGGKAVQGVTSNLMLIVVNHDLFWQLIFWPDYSAHANALCVQCG